MKILVLEYKKETGKSAILKNFLGKNVGYTNHYVEWLYSKIYKNKSENRLMWHIPTNQVGQFKKETNPTGKPTTIVIKLFDGRTYFAPKSEFKSFSLDIDF